MASGPAGNPLNPLANLLCAEPADEEGKLKLLGEVEDVAKRVFKQKDMPNAELLYGKAIALTESIPGKQEPKWYSNRSMVRLFLNKNEDALKDAQKCIDLDPTFVKAYHRKAQALHRMSEWDAAIAAAQEGLQHASDADKKSFSDLVQQAQKDKEKDAEEKANLKRDAQDARVELHNASTARAPPVSHVKKKEDGDANNGRKEDDEDDVDVSMRGYKKRADGKTTSYFHTEISDEAKALIEKQGFGKPQKIDAPADDQQAKGGGSTWNQAGTYEETGMMKWVKDALNDKLVGLSFTVPTGEGGTIVTRYIQELSGDASISVSRGKRRRMMDIAFNVTYEGTVGDASGRGHLAFSEVSTLDDSFQVTCEISSDTPSAMREVFQAFVKNAGHGLQPIVVEALRAIIEDYKQR